MRKFVLPLIALALATPAAAQNADLSLSRMKEMLDAAPIMCRVATKMPGPMPENVLKLSDAQTAEEKVFVLAMCKMYLHGKLDASR